MTISVIIPVLREQALINATLDRIRHIDENMEIIVIDGDPAGSTLAAITDQQIIRLTAPTGRGNQLAAGARAAGGSVLLLLHADTLLPATAFDLIREAVSNGAAWGAFRLGIAARGPTWRLIEYTVDLRSRLLSLPYGDQAIFLTKAALEQVGGIPELPLMEDVALVHRLRSCRSPGILLPDRVQTSARRWQRDGAARRTLHNWWLLLRYLTGTPAERLAREY